MAFGLSNISMSVKVILVALIGILSLGLSLIWITAADLEVEMRQQASARQESNMAVAWEVLNDHGTGFRVADGKLSVGSYVLNDNDEVVDRVRALVGGVATIFMGDVRISTNVKKPDG